MHHTTGTHTWTFLGSLVARKQIDTREMGFVFAAARSVQKRKRERASEKEKRGYERDTRPIVSTYTLLHAFTSFSPPTNDPVKIPFKGSNPLPRNELPDFSLTIGSMTLGEVIKRPRKGMRMATRNDTEISSVLTDTAIYPASLMREEA